MMLDSCGIFFFTPPFLLRDVLRHNNPVTWWWWWWRRCIIAGLKALPAALDVRPSSCRLGSAIFCFPARVCVCGCGLRVRRRRGVGDDEWNLQACVVVAIYSHCYICAYKSSSRIIIIQKHLSGKGKRCSM